MVLIFLSGIALAHYQSDQVEVVSVSDGDTIKVIIQLYPDLTQRVNVRLYGIDTPETSWRAKCEEEWEAGIRAWSYSLYILHHANKVSISNIEFGKFAGRALATVKVDGVDLSQALLDAGHAKPYFGKKKPDWCN